MVPAVILAAGASRRMGSAKALLVAPGGGFFVSRIVGALTEAGISEVVIVTGHHHDAIAAALDLEEFHWRPRLVRNPNPSRGQLSSLWTGMDAVVSPSTPAMLVTLVDVPMIEPAVIARVIDTWRRTTAPIVRPADGDRHGHPVLFDRAVFAQLRAASLEAGAKAVIRAHADRIVNVPVSSEGCLIDVDTPEEYRKLRV